MTRDGRYIQLCLMIRYALKVAIYDGVILFLLNFV